MNGLWIYGSITVLFVTSLIVDNRKLRLFTIVFMVAMLWIRETGFEDGFRALMAERVQTQSLSVEYEAGAREVLNYAYSSRLLFVMATMAVVGLAVRGLWPKHPKDREGSRAKLSAGEETTNTEAPT
jgi:hypothetical protein